MSDISFPGVATAIGGIVLLVLVIVGGTVEAMLATRARPPRWGARLAGPAAAAAVGVAALVAAQAGPLELREALDAVSVAIPLGGTALWAVLRAMLR